MKRIFFSFLLSLLFFWGNAQSDFRVELGLGSALVGNKSYTNLTTYTEAGLGWKMLSLKGGYHIQTLQPNFQAGAFAWNLRHWYLSPQIRFQHKIPSLSSALNLQFGFISYDAMNYSQMVGPFDPRKEFLLNTLVGYQFRWQFWKGLGLESALSIGRGWNNDRDYRYFGQNLGVEVQLGVVYRFDL